MSKVYFSGVEGRQKSRLDKVERLFDKVGFGKLIDEGDIVAIKVHFGERGNTAFLSPIYVRRVVDRIKEAGGRPFITDGNTLYVGSRSNAVNHLITAVENGFSYATVGAPLIISDGLNGHDYIEVAIGGKHFEKVKIGSAIREANAVIALSHFKGHEATGFGGALKNLGMGAGSRGAKQLMHSDLLPTINAETCKACCRCVEWCPAEAISVAAAANIDYEACLGCAECTVTCPHGAISINWKTEASAIQEKIAEHAYGVIKGKEHKVGFMNFIINVVPDCDCWSWNDAPVTPDIGITASTDIVAVDQASADLVNATAGIKTERLPDPLVADKIKALSGIDWEPQLVHAEKLGMGRRTYDLVHVG